MKEILKIMDIGKSEILIGVLTVCVIFGGYFGIVEICRYLIKVV